MRIFNSIFSIGVMTVISRVLGFVRDTLITTYLGAGGIADAFLLAQRFPNLFRRLFAEGAMQSAFIPIFTGLIAENNPSKARQFAGQIMKIIVVVLLALVIIVEIFAGKIVPAILPGFEGNQEMLDLVILFTRINFPYLLFISLVAFYSGILNSLYKFTMVALTPALLNIVTIIFLWLLKDMFPTAGHAASWSVFTAGLVQWLFLLYGCHKMGWLPKLGKLNPIMPEVKTFFIKLIPITLGAGVYQINIIIDVMFMSYLPQGSPTYLYLADRVTQLPLALIGIALGTVILPILSSHIKNNNEKAALQVQEDAILYAGILSIPAAVGLMILATPIVFVLFEHGKFITENTNATAITIFAYAVGVPSASIVKVLIPAFYARGDTKTPFYTTIISLVIYLLSVLVLLHSYKYLALAISTSIASIANMIIILYILKKRNSLNFSKNFFKELGKSVLASIFMGAVLILSLMILKINGHSNSILATINLLLVILLAVVSWVFVLYITKSVTIKQFKRIFKKKS